MKKLIGLLFLFQAAYGQICVQVNCPRTIRLPQDSITLKSVVNVPVINFAWSQTTGASAAKIVSATSASTLAKGLVAGLYVFQAKADGAVAFDTVNVLPACPVVDSAAIINAYLKAHPCPNCPPPIICPVCPPPPKQRTCIGYSVDGMTGKITFIYDDGSH